MLLVKISQLSRALQIKQSKLFVPLADECVSAGFPSPADDYLDIGIDLNEQLIQHPESTFLLRVSGNSMIGTGIHNGDLLIVDRSLEARPGHIIVAVLDGAFTLKRLSLKSGVLYLEADHPNHQPIDLREYENVQVWGVAIHSIHNLNSIKSSK